MIPHCNHPGCMIVARFNIPGKKAGLFCRAHSLDGMVDVVNKRCQHPGCRCRTRFHIPGEVVHHLVPRFCWLHRAVHRTEGTNDASNLCPPPSEPDTQSVACVTN